MRIKLEDDRSGAFFSSNREYRYALWRIWDADKPTIAFIMLNPSTADEHTLDPTCRRCIDYAKLWGYGSLYVGNLFALRSTDPNELYDHPSPIGPANDDHLLSIQETAKDTIVAWGNHGVLHDRGYEVAELLQEYGPLHCLDCTKKGHPVHPLYQPADKQPEPFEVLPV